MSFVYLIVAVVVALVVVRLLGRWKSGKRPALSGTIRGNGNCEFDVVGESHYQHSLERLAGGRSRDGVQVQKMALLVLDDFNAYDNQAVAVEIDGFLVGHLSKKNAREYREEIARQGHAGALFACAALIVGGWDRGPNDKGHFGVKLDLPIK